ncbi:MAG: MG2 domain-containing protein [Bacteroidales bacterium]|nr:MG2 domain-containing protein [Bacteroidales bacterium]
MKRIITLAVIVLLGFTPLFSQPSQTLVNLMDTVRLIAERDEDPLVRTIALFQSDLGNLNAVEQAIVNSMIAESLWTYLQQNRWQIFERTPLANPDLTDVRTWDTRLLLQQTIMRYTASLEPREALQNLRVRDFKKILTLGDNESEIQRPTMFDLLAHRAINALSQHDMRLMQPQDGAMLNDKIDGIFQHLADFHLQEENPDILIPLGLQILAWARRAVFAENADSLYRYYLVEFLEEFPESPVNAQIYWALAEFHNELGSRHNNLVSEDFRWDKKEALRYTEILQSRFVPRVFADAARAMAERIKAPTISLQMQEILLPNQSNLFLLQGSNLDTVYFSLFRLTREDVERFSAHDHQRFMDEVHFRTRTPFREWQEVIPNPGDFQTHRVELAIDPLTTGYYMLLVSTNPRPSASGSATAGRHFSVSELSFFTNTDSERTEGIVLNRRTGQPMRGVNVRVFSRDFNWRTEQTTTTEHARLTTGRDGRFQFPNSADSHNRWVRLDFELQHRSDTLLSLDAGWWNRAEPQENWRRQTFFFTDRAIYRPGQIVYFKGILVERRGDESRIVTNQTTTVRLLDANGREINSVEVRTNEYGSFSGRFVLPMRGLLGWFSLRNESGSSSFSVEEYKRPSFEIVFDPLASAHRLDEEAIVSGVVRTFAGANLGHSTVRYRITRSVRLPFWRWTNWRLPTEEVVISQGEAMTDQDGRFQIWFMADSDKRIPVAQHPIYTFTITIDATDISGETQQGIQSIPISHRALTVSLNARPFMDRTQDSVLRIISRNLSGETIHSQGTIRIYRLLPTDRLLRNRLWTEPNLFVLSDEEFIRKFPTDQIRNENSRGNRERVLVLEKPFNTATTETFVLSGLPRWQTGDYVYTIETQDVFGNPVNHEDFFTVFSPKTERRNPLDRVFYTIVPKTTFEPGETASFIVGSASRITVFYEIRGRNGIVERRQISLNNEQRRINFQIREEHRGNLSLQIWSVIDGRVHNVQQTISVPFTNRNINISIETFRDKLRPGEQETWTLSLQSNIGRPVQGELLLSMYDASLDVFRRNHWHMNLNHFFQARFWDTRNFRTLNSQQLRLPHIFHASVPVIQYDRLNFDPRAFNRRAFARGGMRMASMAMVDDEVEIEEMVLMVEADSDVSADIEVSAPTEAVASDGAEQPIPATPEPIATRTNFNETAFFFPHLRSDESGRVTTSFTAPESLTRWRIQALAHTQDLMVGINEWSAVTQRELMIQPNMPRFLREGDVFKLQARIVNLLDEPLSGEANLGWSISNQFGPIVAEENWGKDFSVPALQNTSVVWAHCVRQTGFLNLNFSARAGNHTDGEARMIPILSNRAMLTETLPMFARANTERTFSLPRLANPNSTTLKNHRLTLQIATNPIWFAVQALPELGDPRANNSIALFGAFFANAMALDILEQNPEIQTVFNRWKMTDSEMLQSNLERNQELKSVLLDETPWLLQAENETRRKHNIAMFFDENNVRNLQADVLTRLRNLQTANGGFAWNPGGRANLWATQYIVQGLQRLHKRNIERDNRELQNILRSALHFCDQQHIERFHNAHPSTTLRERALSGVETRMSLRADDIQFLYLRTYFAEQHPISPQLDTVLAVYDSLARANWQTQPRLLQGILAQYFYLKGDHDLVQKIMENFRRLALHSDEMGMFWRAERSWLWYQSQISTQVQLIETFSRFGNPEEVEEMQRWLLSQKRTTIWNTPKASVEAVYALMSGTPNLSENANVEIQIGNERITTPTTADAGSGLFSKFWTADQIRPDQSEITIRNRGNSMVWGGLFWQYFEDMDKVAPAETPLSIQKTLLVERMTNQGAILEEIPKEGLKIGDVVVARIEIRTDRNLDFVHLKSLRAATFEPIEVRSGYRFQDGLFYYQEVRDVSMNFYFTHLPRGTYVFEYRMIASQIGNFSNGFTTIQCLYAPEFSAQSEGQRVVVN